MDGNRALDFLVDRNDLRRVRFAAGPVPEPADGQVLLRVDRFALTANNVSYAKVGELLRYWDFFPAPEGWGRVPAMGFADVLRSRCPGVAEGERVFGFFPMSRHLLIEPRGAQRSGPIVDGSAHREGISPAYNTLTRVAEIAGHGPGTEDAHMLLRGLFLTSFLIDDFLAEHRHFGARATWIASASSRTAIALAFLLAGRRRDADADAPRVVGVTSARNEAFVRALGCYDEVALYDEVETLPAHEPVVWVDMAGDGAVAGRVHRHLGARLVHHCSVGATHWEAAAADVALPGAAPVFFFAPARLQQRAADWGGAQLEARIGAGWEEFRKWSEGWLRIVRGAGEQALERAWHDALEGRARPDEGRVLSLHEAAGAG